MGSGYYMVVWPSVGSCSALEVDVEEAGEVGFRDGLAVEGLGGVLQPGAALSLFARAAQGMPICFSITPR